MDFKLSVGDVISTLFSVIDNQLFSIYLFDSFISFVNISIIFQHPGNSIDFINITVNRPSVCIYTQNFFQVARDFTGTDRMGFICICL